MAGTRRLAMADLRPFIDALPPQSVFLNEASGVATSYRLQPASADKGGRPPFVLLHGFNGSSKSWACQFAAFADRQLLAIDAPGFGASHPVDGGMAAIADEVAALLDHLGIKEAVIIGHSMGGMLAQVLAARHPSCCVGLVLSCTHKGRAQPPDSPLSADVARRLADRAELDDAAYGHLRVSSMLAGAVAAEVFEFLALIAGEIRPEGIRCGGRAMQILDTTALLPRLAIPVMILSADRDIVVKPDALAALQVDLPQAMIVRLTGVGHAPYCEDAAAFNTSIDRFLTTHDLSCEWRPA